MKLPDMLLTLTIILALVFYNVDAVNSNLFREYIGAEFKTVKFSDVPINRTTNFHFILSFAIDYTTSSTPSPTNGIFNVFWDTDNLSPAEVSSIKKSHPNVKVALSLGGDTVGTKFAYFKPSSVDSWVSNAVSSLTSIIKQYHLDGIDIDYEHFKADPSTFALINTIPIPTRSHINSVIHDFDLIMTLKKNKVISFASIAPFDDDQVQQHYMVLWRRYAHLIDYVNFQFYAYDQQTNVSQFLSYFKTQMSNYKGDKMLVGLTSGGGGGLSPENGFFTACKMLKARKQLYGIFIWSADDSKSRGFKYEKQSQALLA